MFKAQLGSGVIVPNLETLLQVTKLECGGNKEQGLWITGVSFPPLFGGTETPPWMFKPQLEALAVPQWTLGAHHIHKQVQPRSNRWTLLRLSETVTS